LKCDAEIQLRNKVCGECGSLQAPLVEKALSDLKILHDQAERLLTNLEFHAAAEKALVVASETDVRLQQYATWHIDFSARLESSQMSELTRLEELLREALTHEQAYDYRSGLQTLTQVAPLLVQVTVNGIYDTAEEINTRLTTKQSRLKELNVIVRERVTKREIAGLLAIVEELLALNPDRGEVQKLKEQLEKRWRTPVNQLLADGNTKAALAKLELLETRGLSIEQATIYDRTKAIVAAETELSSLVKIANTDGIIDRSDVVELFPRIIQCLELNPKNTAVLKIKNDLLYRMQNDIKGYVNHLTSFPSDVFTYLPSELLTTYRQQNPHETCTLEIAEQYLADSENLSTSAYKWIDLDAAAALARGGEGVNLGGLTNISVEVAEALAKCESYLSLGGLTNISVEVAEALAKCGHYLMLDGLTNISVEVAEALAKCESYLSLDGLTNISVEVAKALAKCEGSLMLDTNNSISNPAAQILRDAGHWE
jgi:hypothetical protein